MKEDNGKAFFDKPLPGTILSILFAGASYSYLKEAQTASSPSQLYLYLMASSAGILSGWQLGNALNLNEALGPMERPEGRPQDPPRRLRPEAPTEQPKALIADLDDWWEEVQRLASPLVQNITPSYTAPPIQQYPKPEVDLFALDARSRFKDLT